MISRLMKSKTLTRPRTGFTMFESVVAAAMLTTAMSGFTAIIVRSGHVWIDTRHQHAATIELSNQLDRLTRLDDRQLREQLDQLRPSDFAVGSLPNPQIEAEVRDDGWSDRLTLRLSWQVSRKRKSIELCGWSTAGNLASGSSAEEEP